MPSLLEAARNLLEFCDRKCFAPNGMDYREKADLENELRTAILKEENQTRYERKPVAWIRYCSDGGYEGPFADCDKRVDEVRRTSGAWTPLYSEKQ